MTATVYIVDDDVAMRDALCRLLESAGQRVACFADGPSFLDACDEPCEGCVLLDLAMPGMSGREVLAAMKERGMPIPVIFLSGHGDIPTAVELVKAGALDFLEKPIQGNQLLEQVRRALERDVAQRQSSEKAREFRNRYARLSPREREVMALVVDGLSNKEAARELGLSPRTVEAHRNHVMQKMGADHLVDLVEMAAHCND